MEFANCNCKYSKKRNGNKSAVKREDYTNKVFCYEKIGGGGGWLNTVKMEENYRLKISKLHLRLWNINKGFNND